MSSKLTFVIFFQKLEAVGLVPSGREDVEGNLAADRESELVAELFFQRTDHGRTDFRRFVVLVECVAL